MKSLTKLLCAVLAPVCLFSAVMTGTLAFRDSSQHKSSAFYGNPPGFELVICPTIEPPTVPPTAPPVTPPTTPPTYPPTNPPTESGENGNPGGGVEPGNPEGSGETGNPNDMEDESYVFIEIEEPEAPGSMFDDDIDVDENDTSDTTGTTGATDTTDSADSLFDRNGSDRPGIPNAPKTGREYAIWVWVASMAVFAFALRYTLLRRKSGKEKKK